MSGLAEDILTVGLGEKLVGEEILPRVPITSLKAVRSTCKKWDALTKRCVLGKEAPEQQHQFLGFATINDKLCSLRFHLGGEEERDDFVSVKQVDLFKHLEISKVYHCDGLVLCIPKDKDNSSNKLLLWNPYLSQTRWIGPRENFSLRDRYAIGYDDSHNHKILRFVDSARGLIGLGREVGFEIYDISRSSSNSNSSSSSSSWRVLEVTPEWSIDMHQRGVTVKGNTYFYAHQRFADMRHDYLAWAEDFLLCFDFTNERFGPPLPLPFHSTDSGIGDCVTLSSFARHHVHEDDQLAVLFGGLETDFFEIWVTLTAVEPNHVSWIKFLRVDISFNLNSHFGGSFFVNEENKVAVLFESNILHTAYVFGQDGYFNYVKLGKALVLEHRSPITNRLYKAAHPPLVSSSSYRPSLVQLTQQQQQHSRKRKRETTPTCSEI
ncbi:unnamed protein product [Eruca vesicaria subsp. sativa]|uniref:F-box associated beta-propeller type 1 domain-containing protein n=1 Tax=Eruca vesicaria subsp. sativa TaxID=29727 RepID=A0ABC8KZV9_ERUVS|nr:unnamed protein product [Eruca vesicaria subsp. sativa]